VYQFAENQAIRFSFNQAHRSPSAIDNYLDISIIGGYFPLGAINPVFDDQQFPIVTRTYGNPNLKSETLTAYEIGYTGTLPWKTVLGASFYLNNTNNAISNSGSPEALIAAGVQPYYTSQNPPPGWPLPPEVIDMLAQQGIYLPANVQTLNLGKVRNKGFEFSVGQPLGRFVNTFGNYSYQALPETLSPETDPYRYPPGALAVPPRNRFNTGVNVNGKRFFGNASVNYAGKAFWTDALQPAYYGYSDAYTLVNGTIGARWSGNKITTSLRAINLLNKDVQQYIFGDILKRRVYGEVQFNF
jgi:outer membrane receptor protein involved in Fe transport